MSSGQNLVTFESLRGAIAAAERPRVAGRRTVHWVGAGPRKVAYSRDREGKLEIFLVGPPLVAHLRDVERRIVHDRWRQAEGDSLDANRLLLPEGEHVDAIAAAILVELLRHDVQEDVQVAFTRTEPLISLALSESAPQSAVVTGLAGELLTMRYLRLVPGVTPSQALSMWKGYGRSSRDFEVGAVGFEVKATTTGESRHHIEGWYQVEPGVTADPEVLETGLNIVSIGIQWLQPGIEGAFTIENLVKSLRAGLTESEWLQLLSFVRGYCGEVFTVDDDGAAADSAFTTSFECGEVRLFDMTDPAIRVLTQGDLEDKVHTVPDSVSFEILLPRVVGLGNPLLGWDAVVKKMGEALGLE